MSIAHAGSMLPIKNGIILPVSYEDVLFPFYWNKISGRGHEPLSDVSTLVKDEKFGYTLAVDGDGMVEYNIPQINGNNLTTACWFKVNSWDIRNENNPYQIIIHHFGWYLAVNRNSKVAGFWSRSPLGGWYHTTSTITLGEWNFISATYDSSKISVYLNGKKEREVFASGDIPQDNTNILSIGCARGESGRRLNGCISNLLISPRAWTAQEIKAVYEYNRPLYDPYNYYSVYGE